MFFLLYIKDNYVCFCFCIFYIFVLCYKVFLSLTFLKMTSFHNGIQQPSPLTSGKRPTTNSGLLESEPDKYFLEYVDVSVQPPHHFYIFYNPNKDIFFSSQTYHKDFNFIGTTVKGLRLMTTTNIEPGKGGEVSTVITQYSKDFIRENYPSQGNFSGYSVRDRNRAKAAASEGAGKKTEEVRTVKLPRDNGAYPPVMGKFRQAMLNDAARAGRFEQRGDKHRPIPWEGFDYEE